jgi:shikimate kinase
MTPGLRSSSAIAHTTVIAMVSLPAAKMSNRIRVRLLRVILPVDSS